MGFPGDLRHEVMFMVGINLPVLCYSETNVRNVLHFILVIFDHSHHNQLIKFHIHKLVFLMMVLKMKPTSQMLLKRRKKMMYSTAMIVMMKEWAKEEKSREIIKGDPAIVKILHHTQGAMSVEVVLMILIEASSDHILEALHVDPASVVSLINKRVELDSWSPPRSAKDWKNLQKQADQVVKGTAATVGAR
ncbi:hypothetical protein V6N11_022858 [Hibiscus sabdariffa]|uniref:Uncharacterized protein n=1 Tax=Hibiscus sabdariffa TaxID=183260 RepID=A0ABR2TKN6_9ROSI